MKRLFIGIPVESEKAALQTKEWRFLPELTGTVLKWTKPENWHITLIFLGSTPHTLIDRLQNLINESFAETPEFHTQITGIGVFPNTHSPKVLWLGVEDLQPLIPGYSRLANLLVENGFDLENKPFKPHLTLARVRNSANGKSIQALLDRYQNSNFGLFSIKSVVLYESISTTDGPVYKPLFVKKLKEKRSGE